MADALPAAPNEALLAVEGLTLEVARSGQRVVENFSLALKPGEIVGVVGESGSGKTMAARAIIGLQPPAIRRVAGAVRFEGRDLFRATPRELRKVRGARIGMVFQEPMTSLNPSMTVGRQIEEGLALHRPESDAVARRRLALHMLERVGIGDPAGALEAYPHQFSGGMRQRIMLASVMLLQPALLIADEPTTALDAVIQRDVLDLMLGLTRDHGTAMLLISHDLPMVARYTDRMLVMQTGEIVEQGRTAELLLRPTHAYTAKLLAALPRRRPARPRAATPPPPIAELRDLVVDYAARRRFLRPGGGAKRAVRGLSLSVAPGEVVALVGGSGSGKTTVGRAIAGLLVPTSGEILYAGQRVGRGEPGWWEYRLNCQMVFQDPYSSLDPRMTVEALVAESLRQIKHMTASERASRTASVLDEVGLGGREYARRFAHELSGGQRQRVAIARAIARRPAFVIADEPVSALDVTVRAQVLDLLSELQNRHGFSCLFISHDLGVVEQIADRVVVMSDGLIVEEGTRDSLFDAPQHPYTRRLLSAIPVLDTIADGVESGGVRLRWRFDDAPAPISNPA